MGLSICLPHCVGFSSGHCGEEYKVFEKGTNTTSEEVCDCINSITMGIFTKVSNLCSGVLSVLLWVCI